MDNYLQTIAGRIDECLVGADESRRVRVAALGQMLARNIPFVAILQIYVQQGASFDFVLADLLALGVRPELFTQELQNCKDWLSQLPPSPQRADLTNQAMSTIGAMLQMFTERSTRINQQFEQEQAERNYSLWLDQQLARNWVMSFMGQSGDPILRSYPGLHGS